MATTSVKSGQKAGWLPKCKSAQEDMMATAEWKKMLRDKIAGRA